MPELKELKCISVIGLQQIINHNGLSITYGHLEENKLLAIVHKGRSIVYEEVIKEEDLPLNKESPVYQNFRKQYIQAKATRYLYLILLERGLISARMPENIHYWQVKIKKQW